MKCDCGHPDGYWHRSESGSVFECKTCHESKVALECLLSDYVQREKVKMSGIAAQHIDSAVSALMSAYPGFRK